MGMVLNSNIQKRIGFIFFIFSSLVLILHVVRGVYHSEFSELINLRIISLCAYCFVFGFSVRFHTNILKLLQTICIATEGILIVVFNNGDYFFGLMLIFVSILLAYVYGYFDSFKIIKGCILSIIFVCIFSIFSLETTSTPWISAVMWVLFLWVLVVILWVILKDYVEYYKTQINNREEVLQESLDSLKRKVEEYAEISHASLSTNKELLKIIRSHEVAGVCNDGE